VGGDLLVKRERKERNQGRLPGSSRGSIRTGKKYRGLLFMVGFKG
jgi:hypothetical protein